MIGKSALNSIQVTLILIFFSKKIIKLEKSPIKYVCLFCKKLCVDIIMSIIIWCDLTCADIMLVLFKFQMTIITIMLICRYILTILCVLIHRKLLIHCWTLI